MVIWPESQHNPKVNNSEHFPHGHKLLPVIRGYWYLLASFILSLTALIQKYKQVKKKKKKKPLNF